MAGIFLVVIRYAWPFLLALAVWGWQEARVLSLDHALGKAQQEASESKALLTAARQRASDLALLYSDTITAADTAAREQRRIDDARFQALKGRQDTLSRSRDLAFSDAAVRVWNDVSAAANGRDAAAPAEPAAGTDSVPANTHFLSEADVIAHDAAAAEAYRDAVRMFHEVRDLYNAARAAQIKVNTP